MSDLSEARGSRGRDHLPGLRQLALFIDHTSRWADFGALKDSVLARLSETANVAQFVSYSPELKQRRSLIRGYDSNHSFGTLEEAATILLRTSFEGRVNVRSFDPKSSKGNAFLYGVETLDDVVACVRELATKGFFTIINETIDVQDGGVSGVVHGDLIEFAPGATPRCVEEPGVTTVDRQLGISLLETVYGFRPDLDFEPRSRVEFSIHPIRRGYRNAHTVIWEIEELPVHSIQDTFPRWPSRFSRLCGDKAFGLLLAHFADLNVPSTLVIPRHLAPFRFGNKTRTGETWIRTCPKEQVPGKYSTLRGWTDPFKLLADEDPEGGALASVLCQDAVDAQYSGALRTLDSGEPLIEGVAGTGERFMQSQVPPESLPERVLHSVRETFTRATRAMGPVRMEWVFDGKEVWVVQLHRQVQPESSWMIYPGNVNVFHRFDVRKGLTELRSLVEALAGKHEGIILAGNVGRTSHMCDLLRQAQVPSRQENPTTT